MTNETTKHYYVQKDGRNVSDYTNEKQAREHAQRIDGIVAVHEVPELDCE